MFTIQIHNNCTQTYVPTNAHRIVHGNYHKQTRDPNNHIQMLTQNHIQMLTQNHIQMLTQNHIQNLTRLHTKLTHKLTHITNTNKNPIRRCFSTITPNLALFQATSFQNKKRFSGQKPLWERLWFMAERFFINVLSRLDWKNSHAKKPY